LTDFFVQNHQIIKFNFERYKHNLSSFCNLALMKLLFRVFLFLAISSFCMEVAYSLAGKAGVELISSDNTDDEEDSDDPCDKKEENPDKTDALFVAYSSPSAFLFTAFSNRTLYAEMSCPVIFHLVKPPYSPPEMI
jgi:hypothetical protein